MPELPDVMLYLDAIRPRVHGETVERITIISPFVLRSVDPPIEDAQGRAVTDVTRLGKRVVLSLDGGLHLVIHLMIAGRFRWFEPGAAPRRPGGRIGLASISFATGTLAITEASHKKRASIHLSRTAGLASHGRGGLDVLGADPPAFREALVRENRTLKRCLTDPRLFDGIGNAYSDEILHRARISPFKLTRSLDDEAVRTLHGAARDTLTEWIEALRAEFDAGRRFPGPGQITAFRPGFSVHGRHAEPCPVCGAPVQRVVYAENEMNYCPGCQTGGKILADRSLSRLLRDDWPKTLDELG